MNDLREAVAALEHEQWAGWMKYLFEQSIECDDGSIEIPASLVMRWKRQMNTSYADLPEDEKASDRTEADKVLDLIHFDSPTNTSSQLAGKAGSQSNSSRVTE